MREYLEEKLQKSGFLWCLHCEKVYKVEGSKKPDYELECPYCGASALFDGRPWEQVREQNKKMNWPVIPEKNKVYSPYN